MTTAAAIWLTLAALLGAAAVIAGALGSHALELAAPEHYARANQYHLIHALALLAVSVLGLARGFDPALHLAAALFVAGMVLFCGRLYGLGMGAPLLPGIAAPIGGSLLILGWLALAVSPWLGDNGSGAGR